MKTDLTGRQFGKLTVLSLVEYRPHSKSKWLCMCECGNTHIVSHSNLVGGNVKTCGCGKIIGKTIHGGKGTRLYRIWRNMKSRCTLPSTINFQNYGGRGIKVCNEWINDFVSFRDWAMANGYAENLSIDRIDVNGWYAPDNCRWATPKEQANNRRNSRKDEV